MEQPTHIAIFNKDNIGDVILSLPITGIIKEKNRDTKVTYISRDYTKPIINITSNIDNFISLDYLYSLPSDKSSQLLKEEEIDAIFLLSNDHKFSEIANKSNIPIRVGSIRKLYNWRHCNKLVFDAHYRSSPIHIAEKNMRFLKKINRYEKVPITHMVELCGINIEKTENHKHIQAILHPGSNLHTIEWPEQNYIDLAYQLTQKNINVIFTGTEGEKDRFPLINKMESHSNIHNLMGKTSLDQLIDIVQHSNLVISASTGISHLASLLRTHSITIFPPRSKQFNYQLSAHKWKPIGNLSTAIYKENTPPKEVDKLPNYGVNEIKPESITQLIDKLLQST